MSLFDKKHLVSPADALPGRNTPAPVTILHAVSGHSMTNVPDGMGVTIFVMNCPWNMERLLRQLPGIYNTATGYIGGYTPDPTYREVCSDDTGHAGAMHIVYDPSVISYEQLLQVSWENHDPAQGTHQGNGRDMQYHSTTYLSTPEQDAAACASLEHFQVTMLVAGDNHCITTEIANAIPFYYAENGHQQYLHKDPYGYYGTDGVGTYLPSEVQRYGYKCRLSIRCALFMPDTA